MKDLIRRGTVTSINYDNGTVKVVYEDRDDSVSFDLPLMSFEYNPPSIGDMIIVAFLANDTTQGFVIGKPYNSNNLPQKSSKDIIRKDLGTNDYIEYNKSTKTLLINVENIKLNGTLEFNGNLVCNGDVEINGNLEVNGSFINHTP